MPFFARKWGKKLKKCPKSAIFSENSISRLNEKGVPEPPFFIL